MDTGLISNIQKYALQDGPGIRTTVFLKGCPLRCAWCHNPENISPRPQVLVFQARCVRCGKCRTVCPRRNGKDGFERSDVAEAAAPFQCTTCGACTQVCPTGARTMAGQRWSTEQLLSEILGDRIFYDDSGGGVTFSGGEPLVQFEFLASILAACRSVGVHTAVDTCGFAPQDHLLAAAQWTDLFLYDVKFMDDSRHQEFCGVSNRLILENLQALARVHPNIWIRVPVIPGINDQDLDGIARFVSQLPGLRQVNLLPYHRTGVAKFERMGQAYTLAEVVPPTADRMEAIRSRFAAAGLNAKTGG